MHNKLTITLVAVYAVASVISCNRDDITGAAVDDRNHIVECVGLTPSVEGYSTRGALVHNAVFDTDSEFWVSAWSDDGTPEHIIPTSASVSEQNAQYAMARYFTAAVDGVDSDRWGVTDSEDHIVELQWNFGEIKTFYAYANLPETEGAAAISNTAAGQILEYDATKVSSTNLQTDILLACYQGDGTVNGVHSGTASLNFCHPLTAVLFKAGELQGHTIKSISIEGLYETGKVTQSPSSPMANGWTDRSGAMTVTEIMGAGQTFATGDTLGNIFLLIPQDFEDNTEARVAVTFVDEAGEEVLYIPLEGYAWVAGQVNVFVINYERTPLEEPYVSFSAPTSHKLAIALYLDEYIEMVTGRHLYYFEYSFDKVHWFSYELHEYYYGNGEELSFGGEDTLYIRGYNPNGLGGACIYSSDNYISPQHAEGLHFVIDSEVTDPTPDVRIAGNIMALLDKEGKVSLHTDRILPTIIMGGYDVMPSDLAGVFRNNAAIQDASHLLLPALELSQFCYAGMFSSCKNLEYPPQLPATKLATGCYASMFSDCTKLKEAPRLDVEELPDYCYTKMFFYCKDLKSVTSFKAKNMGRMSCHAMFYGSGIETFPDIDADTLGDNCFWSMFRDCEELKASPKINAKVINAASCRSMFAGCIKLETASDIQIDEIGHLEYSNPNSDGTLMFSEMFAETAIKKAPKLPQFLTAPELGYESMFADCINLETAPDLPATDLRPGCYSDMFADCISLETAPELPATNLAESCYCYMFRACKKLVETPLLPATILTEFCYEGMFQGCSSLSYVSSSAVNITDSHATDHWLDGVASTGVFRYNPELESGELLNLVWGSSRGVSGIPVGWTTEPLSE